MTKVNSKKGCRSCKNKSKKNIAESHNTEEYKFIKKYTSQPIQSFKQHNVKSLTSIDMGKKYANRYIFYYSAVESKLEDCVKIPFKQANNSLSIIPSTKSAGAVFLNISINRFSNPLF